MKPSLIKRCILTGLILGVIQPARVLAIQYKVVDLGITPTATFSEGVDINDKGQVAVRTWSPTGFKGFLWENGSRVVVNTNHPYNSPRSINLHGDIVGYASDSPSDSNALVWQNGTITYIQDAPGGQDWGRAEGINDEGLIVGWSLGDPNNQKRAFTWKDGVRDDLGIIDVGFAGIDMRDASEAIDVNNIGQIVGFTSRNTFPNTTIVPWVLFEDEIDILPKMPMDNEANVVPVAINENGVIIGSYSSRLNGFFSAIWKDEDIHQLRHLDNKASFARGLNDFETIVGFSSMPANDPEEPFDYFATLWDSPTNPINLNDYLNESGNGWVLERANAINNQGWIVGQGVNPLGLDRGFLLIPVPEPESAILVLIALTSALIFRCSKQNLI